MKTKHQLNQKEMKVLNAQKVSQIRFYINKQFYFKQFSLAEVHNLIVKNISISNYSV